MTIKRNTTRWTNISGKNIKITCMEHYDSGETCQFSGFSFQSWRPLVTFRRFNPIGGWTVQFAEWVSVEFINSAHHWLKKNLSGESE